MQWSKLKKKIEVNFAPSVQGKVHLYSTQYGCNCGRAWITYNGDEIANFETILNLKRVQIDREPVNELGHVHIEQSERTPGETLSRGEMNRWDLHKACWEFLQMPIEQALVCSNPLIQGLCFLDHRLGKRRLSKVGIDNLHPIAKRLFEIRTAEDLRYSVHVRDNLALEA